MKEWVFACLLCFATSVHAENLQLCYAYGCSANSDIEFTPVQIGELQGLFKNVRSAEAERESAALAVGLMYLFAGTQSPIWQDRGRNDDDEDSPGRMDCIDHSTNTTTFLIFMDQHGWLRFHEVGEPIRRGVWNVHWGAHLIERSSSTQYVVDSWFFDPGEPAVVFGLENWRSGAEPSLVRQAP